ncbi:MAG: hypothetical protein AAGA17_12995 [Actinomycetota bacterium]
MAELFLTLVVTVVVLVPIGLVVAALLDAASRPDWVWALAGHNKPGWMAAIIVGGLFVLPGLIVALVYGLRIRPHLRAIEGGRLD